MAAGAPTTMNILPATTTAEPPSPPGAHILITGASSGLGRAFFEHFSSFPPSTHHVRGIDARPYPTHPGVSSGTVGQCGRFTQVDLTAEALVQKFVRNAVLGAEAATAQSRSAHSRTGSNSTNPLSLYREQQQQHHQQQQPQPQLQEQQLSPRRLSNETEARSSPPPTPGTPLAPPSTSQHGGKIDAILPSDSQAQPQQAMLTPPSPPPFAGPFTLVIHCAGIRGLAPAVEAARPNDVAGAETIGAMDAATMRRAYETNTVAAFTLVKALLPSLLRLNKGNNRSGPRPKVVFMASRMGSIGSNGGGGGVGNGGLGGGGGYAYRASKAALNAVVRSFSIDVPEVVFALVHPGRVETGLVRTKEDGAVDVAESVDDVLKLIDRLGDEDGLASGCFVDRWGKTIPW